MTILDLINNVPLILNMIVPGYVFIKMVRAVFKLSSESFETTLLLSLVISYIISTTISFFWSAIFKSQIPILSEAFFSILFSFISAMIIIRLRTKYKDQLEKALKWMGKITGSHSIWENVFDVNKGNHIRCFGKYNYEEVMIEGKVLYFDPCSDGECDIVLTEYTIKYKGNTREYKNPDSIMHLNTRNVYGIEVKHGKAKS